ncbi:uncharacterized protein [Euphorbia lathyris]|uniref:uncharacterized protein isoform X3 n=1 Tax=Euphorbia lathyris TaxID=212925 RepID=UPI00331383A7
MEDSGEYRPSFMYEDVFTGVKYPAVSFPRIAQAPQKPEEQTTINNSNASSSRVVEDHRYLQQPLNQSDKHNPGFISDGGGVRIGTKPPADAYPGTAQRSQMPKSIQTSRLLEDRRYLQQLLNQSDKHNPGFVNENFQTGIRHPADSYPGTTHISQPPEEGTLVNNSNLGTNSSSLRFLEGLPYLQQGLSQHNPIFIDDDFSTETRNPADSYPGTAQESQPPKEGTLLNESNLISNPSSSRLVDALPYAYLQQVLNNSDKHNPMFIKKDFWTGTRRPADSAPGTAQPPEEQATMNNLNLSANVAYSRLVQDNHYLQRLLNKSDKQPGDSIPRIPQNDKSKAQMNVNNSHSNFNSGASSSRVHEDPQLPTGTYENSAEIIATVTKIAQQRRRRIWPGSRRILHDRTSTGYEWMASGWLCEERIMAHRRVYRYYYDPAGQMYKTLYDAKAAMSRLNNNSS